MKKQKKHRKKAKHRGPEDRSQPVQMLERRTGAPKPARKPSKSNRSAVPAVASSDLLYSREDRQALTLLMLPILMVAFAISTSQSSRMTPSFTPRVTEPALHHLPSQDPLKKPALVKPQTITAVEVSPPLASTPGANLPADVATAPPPADVVTQMPVPEAVAVTPADPATQQSVVPAAIDAAAAPIQTVDAAKVPAIEAVPVPPSASEVVALLVPEPSLPTPSPPVTAPTLAAPAPETMCLPEAPVKRTPAFFLGDKAGLATIDQDSFGRALAAAAREQLDDFTVYTDKYQTLRYPMGDLPAFYGVCTDVIVRAYRELGLDLQQLVHLAKVGSGDTNIDHRRVGTLQKFFAKHGDSLPITEFGEDYMPGDIVSYYRPQNAHSRTHIAIVSDVAGPSGQLMIIHNRGWGPQIEDALFVDQITGHYRYSGTSKPVPATVATRSLVAPAPGRAADRSKIKSAPVRDRAALSPPKTGSIQR